MKAIKNIAKLNDLLSQDNAEWQKIVYEQTGVVVVLNRNGGILFSNCGYLDLDYEAEYCWKNGRDCTSYCEILSIRELVEYIKEMDGYKEFLCDVSYGKFTKSDLFWAIYAWVICPDENQKREDGSIYQDWGLYKIGMYNGHVDLYMALVDYDSCEFWMDINQSSKLSDVVEQLVKEMNEITEGISEISQYKVIMNDKYSVPHGYDDLKALLAENGLFHWLA